MEITHRAFPAIVLAVLMQLLNPWHAAAQDHLTQRLESRRTIVLYRDTGDLARFNSGVRYSPTGSGLGGLFQRPTGDDLLNVVARKMDAIYERVQEILEMRGDMEKVTIRVHPDQESLAREWHSIMGRQNLRVRAWYIYERNTIYVNARDVTEGIVAHEIAHAIINNYLLVRPPRATAEILATHVDRNL